MSAAPLAVQRRRGHQRGSAAVETAFSLIILMIVLSAGFNIAHAMVVRHRLLSATTRAARICSLLDPAVAAQCVRTQVENTLGGLVDACRPLNILPRADTIGGVAVLRAEATCRYAGGPWSGLLDRWGGGPDSSRFQMRAEATMPTR